MADTIRDASAMRCLYLSTLDEYLEIQFSFDQVQGPRKVLRVIHCICFPIPQPRAASQPPAPSRDGNVTASRLLMAMERALPGAPGSPYLANADVQRHERRNALHTLQGLMELSRHAEKRPELFAASTDVPLAEIGEITKQVGDSLVRAHLVGKLLAASDRGVELRLSPGSCLPSGSNGAGGVVAVLGNLIDNAMDAVAATGRPEPWVEVSLRQERGVVELRVTDNGPGVARRLRQRIFVRGFSTKQSSPGRPRGLGLALVLAIAAERSGSVAVADRDGGGATFTIRMAAIPECLGMPADARGTRQRQTVSSGGRGAQ